MGEPTRDRVNVTQLGGDAGMCRKCGVEAVEVNERVTARKAAGVYPDTPSVVARQFFMRCPKCSDEWMLHEQAMQFERELSVVTFHEYRHITAKLSARLTVLEQENAELRDVAYLADVYLEYDGSRKRFNASWAYDTRRKLDRALSRINLAALYELYADYGQQPARRSPSETTAP